MSSEFTGLLSISFFAVECTMPPKGGSRRSRAAKAIYAKRERNEFNELCPGPPTTTKKAATEAPESCIQSDPVTQIAHAVRVLVSQDIGDRDKRAVSILL